MGLIINRVEEENMLQKLRTSIANADEIYLNVSFIRDSGAKLIVNDLKEAKRQGKIIKILTSDYLNVTEPSALYRFLDFVDVKIFENEKNISFHPKTYIFKNNKKKEVEVIVGSSNLTYSALVQGVEWNYRLVQDYDSDTIKRIFEEFDELYNNSSFNLTLDWLRDYEKRYRKSEFSTMVDPPIVSEPESSYNIMSPIKFQIPALYELSKTREEGYDKAMVVVATGLGKTYLSAFDSLSFNRILFIAHREEILDQTYETYKKVHLNKTFGFFKGDRKDQDVDVVFASVQTLGKKEYLTEKYFHPEYFDYIVVDEFHHAEAKTYRNIINYFKPKFLLGLTATPDRNDNGDVYALCDYNIAYSCDFVVGINSGWLTPFEYHGIFDDVDYEQIPWRNGNFDIDELEKRLMIDERSQKILRNYNNLKQKSAVGFCASVKHCIYMNDFFKKNGIRSDYIIGATSSVERKKIMDNFKEGKIEIIFTVDIFNEGVDLPNIDTVLFLRPTNSFTVFMQQLGRGLRTKEGKEKLVVIDMVGNYKGAENKAFYLMGKVKPTAKDLNQFNVREFEFPYGCNVNFDLEYIDYIKQYTKTKTPIKMKLMNEFEKVTEIVGQTPTILDVLAFSDYPVNLYIRTYKSWYNLLKEMNKLNSKQENYSELLIQFLEYLEINMMSKSYKIPVFLSLFENGLKEKVTFDEMAKTFYNFYREPGHSKDFTDGSNSDWKKWDLDKYKKLALQNPVKFLTENKASSKFFAKDSINFILNPEIYKEISEDSDLLQEILDRIEYRKNNYFRRIVQKEDENEY